MSDGIKTVKGKKKSVKSKFYGFEKVFSFTLLQTFKSKSILISTLIMGAMFFFSVPLANMLGSDGMTVDGVNETKIEKVYIASNESYVYKRMSKDSAAAFKEFVGDIYDDVEFEIYEGNMENLKDKMKEEGDYCVYVDVNMDITSGGYVIDVRRTKESKLGEVDTSEFGDRFADYFDELRRNASGLTKEQVEFAKSPVTVDGMKIETIADLDETKDDKKPLMESTFAFVIFIMCIMIFTMAGENIATSLITEKSTRVIEYVLVSIKPLALVFGKIMASVAAVLIQVIIFATCGFASFKIFGGESGNTGDVIEKLSLKPVVDSLSVPRVILAAFILIIGLAMYTTIASLIGSTASRIEQLQESIMVYSMICVVGAYTAMVLFIKTFDPEGIFDMFVLGFPLSAPFITPYLIMSGEVSILAGLIIMIIQIVALLLIALFVAKVFETLILYNGAKVKIKDLIRFARNSKQKGVADEK